MRLRQQLLTKNDCYKARRTIQVKGVMVHSTGANNPKVCRYVPGDAEMGLNTADNHWDRPDLTKCVHAFVGKFADGGVGTVQTLPWSHRGWHAGGAANNTHIGFEICEDGLENPVYFAQVYQEAAELTAMLCRQYGLDPLEDGVVICHQEGFRRGVASNHADVLHWFPKMGKPMDDFRAEVARLMKGEDDVTYEQWKEFMEQYRQELGQQPAPDWGEKELERAKELGLTDGSRPQDLATRQEVASMIIRAKA
jgi:uncharacterized protein YeaO (DUF488 family)